jgi:nitrate reductase NapE component
LHVWTQTQAASIFRNENRDKNMLETIAIVLLILWLLGMVSATTVGGFVHVLLVFAIIIILVRVIRGRK